MDDLSRYWAQPISNVVLAVAAILLLYPVIWRLTGRHLSDVVEALKIAKDIPGTLEKLADAVAKLQEANTQFKTLKQSFDDSLEGVNDRIEIANRQLADLQKSAEQTPPEPLEPAPAGKATAKTEMEVDNWTKVSLDWFTVRDYIEGIVGKIADGRKRRKYNSISRYYYEPVTDLLVSDKLIDPDTATTVNKMDRAFRSLRNKRTPVTAAMVEEFTSWRNQILASSG
jgi:hypothetical protein